MSDIQYQARPLFTIIFEDESFFAGGTSYFETKWREIPKKKRMIVAQQPRRADKLIPYLKQYRTTNKMDDNAIKEFLIKNGWDAQSIDEAIRRSY